MPYLHQRRCQPWRVLTVVNGRRRVQAFWVFEDASDALLEASIGSISPRVPDDRMPGGIFTIEDCEAWIECADALLSAALRRRGDGN